MLPTRILYIEDEQALGKIVKDMLEKKGYEVRWETNGAKVIPQLEDFSPDVCVLDVMLPGINGFNLCRMIRAMNPGLPIIFLTAKTETSDLVKGFESGGTDYIRKPFSIEELMVRIENQLNLKPEHRTAAVITEHFTIGKYKVDTARYELHSPAGIKKLSNRDMQVLKMLFANRNSVTPRKDILLSVWGDDSYFNSRNLDVYIRKLRRSFAGDPTISIITLKSNGYLFLVP